ncbi:serine O-acetyltransferase [Pseudomonas sp. GB2N2]
MNAVKLYRIGNWFYKRRVPIVPSIVRNVIFLLFNSYIPVSATIGKGSVFAYGAIGVVVHANARVGSGCVLGQGITIGAAEGYVSNEVNKCPVIGDNCYIGAGAKIIGDIKIGNNCQIGASAVVLTDVPDNSIVVGIPARVVGRTSTDYRAIRLS